MKRKILFFLLICFIFFNFFCNVYADDVDDLDEVFKYEELIETSSKLKKEPIVNSRIAVAFDRKTGDVIWGKNENNRTAMASTTKIMTAIIALENSDLNSIVNISSKAACTGGSRLDLKKGDKIILHDLLYGLMLRSGNDAAVAIAEHIAGNVEDFAKMMNEKAKELQLENTHFVTPHGLDNENHYTTAVELAKLTDFALKNEKFKKIVSTKQYTIKINNYSKAINNTNELLGVIRGVNGVKTGFTGNAGRCLVTSINRDNFEIIVVVLQADTKKDRGRDSVKIIEYIYNNYELFNIKEYINIEFEKWKNVNKKQVIVERAYNSNVELKLEQLDKEWIILKKINKEKLKSDVVGIFRYIAPIEKGKTFGYFRVFENKNLIMQVIIYFENEIKKKNVWIYFKECIEMYAF